MARNADMLLYSDNDFLDWAPWSGQTRANNAISLQERRPSLAPVLDWRCKQTNVNDPRYSETTSA